MTWLSLRVIVGESAGAIVDVGVRRLRSRELVLRHRTAAVNARGHRATVWRSFCNSIKLICKRSFLGQNGAEFLPDLDRFADFRFPFAHRAGERGLDRVNRFVRLNFAKRIVERDGVAGLFSKARQFSRCEFLRP